MALGSGSKVTSTAGALGAIGYGAPDEDTSATWKSTQNAVAVGSAADNVTRQIIGVAAGTADTDAVNVAQLKGVSSVVVGTGSNINTGSGIKFVAGDNVTLTTTDNVITIAASGGGSGGVTNLENGSGTKSVQTTGSSTASGAYSVAMGFGSQTGASYTDSDNNPVYVGGTGAVAMGNGAIAYANGSVAFGASTAGAYNESTHEISGEYAFAAGKSIASGAYSVAMGASNISNGKSSVAIGASNISNGESSVAMGANNATSGDYSVALGKSNNASGEASVAMGNGSKAYGLGSVALGASTAGVDGATTDTYAFAVGKGAEAQLADSVALGSGSKVTSTAGAKGVTGYGAPSGTAGETAVWKSTQNAVAVGYIDATTPANSVTRQIIGVAAGTNDTDAVNVAQLKSVDSKIGTTSDGTYVKAANTVGANLNALDINVKKNADNIGTNTTNISTNTSNISTLQGYFTNGKANEAVKATQDGSGNVIATTYATNTALTTVSGKVDTNTGNISTLQGYFTNGKANEAVKATQDGAGNNIADTYATKTTVSNLSTQVTTNTTAIATNKAAIDTNTAAIATNKAAIDTNTTAIATNKAAIDTNTTAIATNKAAIDTNTTAIATNKAAIDTNTTAIVTNTTNITANTNAIQELKGTGISAEKVTQIETNKTNIATNTNSIATLTGDASTAGSVANTAKNYSAITVGGTTVDNTGSGVELAAGSNVQLSVENNKITITSTGGTDTTAVHYDTDSLGTKTSSVTFYDKDGKTQATGGSVVTLKNAQLEINGTESGGSSTKVEQGSITVSGGTSEGTTTTVINEKGIYTGTGGVKYVTENNTVAENLVVIDKKVTMIDADEKNVTDYDTESAKASGNNSTAVGYNTESSGATSTAVGFNNQVSGENSTAIGTGNVVTGDASGAFGDPSYIYGSGSYSVGNNNTIGSESNANLGKDTFVLGSNITTTANNSVVLGANSTATEDNVVSVGSEGNERRITNVAAGTKATDAVNYGQFSSLSTQINQSYNYLNNEIGRVGALSAALAGLHPNMTPGSKGTFAMAFGGYGGKRAIAAGGFYAPTDRVTFSAGIGFSEGGSRMGNVGVSFALDAPKRPAVSRMTSEQINAMLIKVEEQNKALKAQNAELKKDGGASTAQIAKLQHQLATQEEKNAQLEARNKKQDAAIALLLKKVEMLEAKVK